MNEISRRLDSTSASAPVGSTIERGRLPPRLSNIDAEPLDTKPLDTEPLDAEPLDAEPLAGA